MKATETTEELRNRYHQQLNDFYNSPFQVERRVRNNTIKWVVEGVVSLGVWAGSLAVLVYLFERWAEL